MKKILYLTIILAIAFSAVGCKQKPASNSSAVTSSVSSEVKEPVKVVTSIDVAIPLQFDYAEDFSDGLALIGTNLTTDINDIKYGYIDSDGKTVIELDQNINYASSFVDGIAMIARAKNDTESEINFIDKTGKILLDDWTQDERFKGKDDMPYNVSRILTVKSGASNFAGLNEYNAFYSDKGVALFDKNLNNIIPYGVYGGMFCVPDTDFVIVSSLQSTSDNTYPQGVIKADGTELAPMEYTSIQSIPNVGFKLNGAINSGCKLMLFDGTIVEPQNNIAFDFIYVENKDAIIFSCFDANSIERWGVMDKTGKVLVEPTFENRKEITGYELDFDESTIKEEKIATPPKKMVTLWQDENYQIFATGEQYNAAYEIEPDVKVGLATLDGEVIIPAKHEALSTIHEGVYKLSESLIADSSSGWKQYSIEYFVLMSADGKIKSETYYSMGNLSQDMVVVSDGEKFGFLRVNY